jgi:hypothetical protein
VSSALYRLVADAKPAGLHAYLMRLGLGEGQELPTCFKLPLAAAARSVIDAIPDDAHDVHEAAFNPVPACAWGAKYRFAGADNVSVVTV